MSSESDFDINDSDEESVKLTKTTSSSNGKRANTSNAPQNASKKKRSASCDDDEPHKSDDCDDDEDDFLDSPKSSAKKPTKSRTPTTKQSSSKPLKQSSSTKIIAARSDAEKTSGFPSSSSSSSSSSAVSIVPTGVVGGSDITRGANITTESAAKKLILQYLKLQNRPYSAIQVFDNLHKRIAKPTVERCLTTLSETEGGLRCKEYGKAKIYFFDQKNMGAEMSSAEMDALDKTISDMKKKLEKSFAEEKALKYELAAVQNEPTDADLDSVLNALTARVSDKREQVQAVGSSNMAPNALRDAIRAHNFFRGKWRNRKDALIEVIDAISSDGMEKKTSVVMAGMGIETDEDVSVSIPAVIPEIN